MAGERAYWRGVTVAVVSTLALSACGSTVQWQNTSPEGDSGAGLTDDGLSLNDDGLSVVSPGPEDPGPSGTPDRGTEGVPGTTGSDGSVEASPSRRGGSTTVPPGAPAPGTAGRGYSAKEIYVGFTTQKGGRQAAKDLGVASGDAPDEEAVVRAIVKDLNSRGGVAGRKLVPVFYDHDTGEYLSNTDASQQRACAAFTEDRQVFAVLNRYSARETTLRACLTKRSTPLVTIFPTALPRSEFSRHAPYLYAPIGPSLERYVPQFVKRLDSNRYFDGGWDADTTRPGVEPTKIGILHHRQDHGPDFARIARQEVERHGYDVAATYQAERTLEGFSSQMQEAVFRFKSRGVTHVVGFNALFFWFSFAAEQQEYRPRYAVGSYDSPNGSADTMDPEQLTGALGVGWTPASDVGNAHDPGDVSASQTRCREIMKDAGQNTSDRLNFLLMVSACDGFNFLVEAIKKGGLSAQGLRRGTQAMGSLAPASTFRIAFADGRVDGVAAVRDLGYRKDCNCFVYLSRKNHGL